MALEFEPDDVTVRAKPAKSARAKLMDLLARRGHSELELRQKLSRHYPEAEIEDALAHARAHNWLMAPEDLRDAFVASLERRAKSHAYMAEALRAKDLPSVELDPEIEIEKALRIAQTKIVGSAPLLEERLRRALESRGFDEDTIEATLATLTEQKM